MSAPLARRQSTSGRGRGSGGGPRRPSRGNSEHVPMSPWKLGESRLAFVNKHPELFCAFPFAPVRAIASNDGASGVLTVAAPTPVPPAADAAVSAEGAPAEGGGGGSGRRRRRGRGDAGESAHASGSGSSRRRRRRRNQHDGERQESAVDRRLPAMMPQHIEAGPDDADDIICSICCVALVNAGFQCGHNKYCMHCCTTLLDRANAACPDCREPIERVIPRFDIISSRAPRVAVPQLPPLPAADVDAIPQANDDDDDDDDDDDGVDLMAAIRQHRQTLQLGQQRQQQHQQHDADIMAAVDAVLM